MPKKQTKKRNQKGTVTVEVFRDRLRLRLPRQVFNGFQKYFTLGIPDTQENRELAEAKAKIIEADIAFERFDTTLRKYQPNYVEDKYPPLLELWDKFTEEKKKQLTITTIAIDYRKVRNQILALPSYLNIGQPKSIRSHLKKKLSPDAAKRTFNYIKSCCEWAFDEEIIHENPFANLKLKTQKKVSDEIKPFTKDERDRIIKAFAHSRHYRHYLDYVKFLFFTGCRTSEAIALQRKHISADFSIITFSEAVVLGNRKDTKTHKTRRFPINEQLRLIFLNQLASIPDKSETIFLSPKGNAIDPHNFLNRAWKKILKGLPEIEYRPQYNTRHTFITLCLEEGVPVQTVAQWVGSSARTIYAHYAGLVSNLEVPEL